jgi:hypothetical protein
VYKDQSWEGRGRNAMKLTKKEEGDDYDNIKE